MNKLGDKYDPNRRIIRRLRVLVVLLLAAIDYPENHSALIKKAREILEELKPYN